MTSTSPPSSSDAALAREIVSGLIDACRDGEHVFALASRAVTNPMLRAELAQYSVQRGEFVVELHEVIRSIGDDADDRGPAAYTDDARWVRLERAAETLDRVAILEELDRHEVMALDAYRNALQAHLPYTLASLLNTQFLAITRVQNRLQSLAENARGNSPTDR